MYGKVQMVADKLKRQQFTNILYVLISRYELRKNSKCPNNSREK